MLLKMLRDLGTRLSLFSAESASGASICDTPDKTATDYELGPVWHGDHWQNLLSSPMDARHYVMEDWSVVPDLELAPVAETKHRSR
jgi:hypothetical protein